MPTSMARSSTRATAPASGLVRVVPLAPVALLAYPVGGSEVVGNLRG